MDHDFCRIKISHFVRLFAEPPETSSCPRAHRASWLRAASSPRKYIFASRSLRSVFLLLLVLKITGSCSSLLFHFQLFLSKVRVTYLLEVSLSDHALEYRCRTNCAWKLLLQTDAHGFRSDVRERPLLSNICGASDTALLAAIHRGHSQWDCCNVYSGGQVWHFLHPAGPARCSSSN